jgi:plasmid maintenance system killer protein
MVEYGDVRVTFGSPQLRERFESLNAGTRAWGPNVAKRYVMRVKLLRAAPGLQAVGEFQSLRLHPLQGARHGQWAINLDQRWRLVFRIIGPDKVRIEEVSNHYDD